MNDADLLADLNALLSGSRSQGPTTGDDGDSGNSSDGPDNTDGGGAGGSDGATAKTPIDEEALRARLRAFEEKVNAPYVESVRTE